MMGLEIRHWCCHWHRDREIFWGKYKTLAAAGRRDTDRTQDYANPARPYTPTEAGYHYMSLGASSIHRNQISFLDDGRPPQILKFHPISMTSSHSPSYHAISIHIRSIYG